MTITGNITRLVPNPDGGPGRIFFRPDTHVDLRQVDGKHRAGGDELVAVGALEGRKVGEAITCKLTDGDPNESKLTAA